ncbi:MAG: methyl-accepting chemotaxis protein, partial [Lachnospiraceae bacterium]|nr:methyl-accepting chemotaxis protein [Lachnospiraceae bacterium]
MKQRSRKLSIRMKIILSVIAIMVIVFGFLGGTSIITMRTNLIEMGGEQAQVAAGLALGEVNADDLMKLKPGDEDGTLYNSIVEPLREMQKACGVKYMYTLTTDGSKVYYGVDTDESDGRCSIGEEYNHTYADLKDVFEGGSYVADEIENDGFGDLIIAYEPIKDANGKVVAILASDYDASGITTRINGMAVNIAVLSVTGFVLAFIITFFVAGMLTKGVKQVNLKLYDLVHNEGDLTQKLNVKSGDEMEIMANNLNELLDYIRGIMLKISENSTSLHESCTLIAENLQVSADGVTDVSATMEEM